MVIIILDAAVALRFSIMKRKVDKDGWSSLLNGGICDFYAGSRKLGEEIVTKSFCTLWQGITDDESRVLGLGILFREKVVGHFRTHAAKTDEACSPETRYGTV